MTLSRIAEPTNARFTPGAFALLARRRSGWRASATVDGLLPQWRY